MAGHLFKGFSYRATQKDYMSYMNKNKNKPWFVCSDFKAFDSTVTYEMKKEIEFVLIKIAMEFIGPKLLE